MSHRRLSRTSTSSEQSATSENIISDEFPDVALEYNSDFKYIDRKRFNFALAEANDLGTVDLTGFCEPVAFRTNFEEKEIDLTQEDISLPEKLAPPFKISSKKAPKESATKKQEKEDKKKEAAAERELKKQLKEDEKRAKMEQEEINKMYKPGECLKHIQLEMHPDLSKQWFMEDVKREVCMLGVKVVDNDRMELNTLAWTREEPRMLINNEGLMKLSSVRRECSHKIYLVQASDILNRATTFQPREGGTYVVLRGQGPMSNGRADQMKKSDYADLVCGLQIDVLVQCKVQLVLVDSSMELGLLVLRYTRAVADAPYKKARREIDEQAEFYMRGDNKNCVTVDKDGNGLSRLWEQMIATLPLSSLEVARTLGAEYKTPRELTQELESFGGMSRIAQLGVARTNVPGSKARKLGPEFTRKLHTLFTCEDGNKLIE